MSMYDFKTEAVRFYQKTYENILSRIISGHLIHVDETDINLRKEKGYVWVFTNMEEVVFIYKPTRRDINSDLLANPFDDEFKGMIKGFTVLLRSIINTVDKHGLKRRNLSRHKLEVKRYFKKILSEKYKSELAQKYQKRFNKNINKLFTFLDYDGVPWNNNYVEHAIKAFANHRVLINGSLSEAGIKDYLVLLSIYQTCRYKGINFLDFLLSRETDI